MNECVKTGLKFHCLTDDSFRTGDLFYYPDIGLFQIRGVPDRVISKNTEEHKWLDIKVLNCIFSQRANECWLDSNLGISLIDPSPDFIKHIREWYPELKDHIVGVENGKAA